MYQIFDSGALLDKRAISEYGLTEDILMENAAAALESAVLAAMENALQADFDVLIAAGGGDNGGDGWTLARRLHGRCRVGVYCVKEPKSVACIRQAERALKVGVARLTKPASAGIVVDCLVGRGLSGPPDSLISQAIEELNDLNAYKIACDMPSGLGSDGVVSGAVFYADETIAMGVLSSALYSDMAKDCTGRITAADLGISPAVFSAGARADLFLLRSEDLELPLRRQKNSHKGSYGHCAVFSGSREGASLIAGKAALAFGAGLVSLVECGESLSSPPFELMHGRVLPARVSAMLAGPGLGSGIAKALPLIQGTPRETGLVLDADMLRSPELPDLLRAGFNRLILTPHVAEFSAMCSICLHSTPDLSGMRGRKQALLDFMQVFPHAAVILKGANTIIACEGNLYIYGRGTQALAKAGSGDVLAGLAASLLAQGYPVTKAACSAVIAHGEAARALSVPNYNLTPHLLIEGLGLLGQ